MNGAEHLLTYRNTGSDDAFAQVVKTYAGLVYSVALRRLSNSALAEDATQTVFARLAGGTPRFKGEPELVAWLHRTTLNVSIDLWRSESRRHQRELKSAMEPLTGEPQPSLWSELAPHLDQALDMLGAPDRQVLLLRFFDRKSMRDLGGLLGISEDAAKMRVSRALEKLRAQFALAGVTCAAAPLEALLSQSASVPAPEHLAARVLAHHAEHVAPQGALGIQRPLPQVLRSPGFRWAVTAGGAAGVAALLLQFLPNPVPSTSPNTARSAAAQSPGGKPTDDPNAVRAAFLNSAVRQGAAAEKQIRVNIQVVDEATGTAIAGAKISAVYFFAGGEPEGHERVTDADGRSTIPEPNRRDPDHGMNAFFTADGYVPEVVQWNVGKFPTEFRVGLPPAATIGGTVADEEGNPVSGARILFERSAEDSRDSRDSRRIALNHRDAVEESDASGHWASSHIPRDYHLVSLYVMHDGYAVTLGQAPVGGPDSMNTTLVLKRGFTITGTVRDEAGAPVPGASIREVHNFGYPLRHRAESSADGRFELAGLGQTWARDGILDDAPKVHLVIEAPGFAPRKRTVPLTDPQVQSDFTLDHGRVFRGRVTDTQGMPLRNAVVRTDSDNDGLRMYDWSTHTDAEGRFEWEQAPEEPVLFWFEADGYEGARDVLIQPDDADHDIRLRIRK